MKHDALMRRDSFFKNNRPRNCQPQQRLRCMTKMFSQTITKRLDNYTIHMYTNYRRVWRARMCRNWVANIGTFAARLPDRSLATPTIVRGDTLDATLPHCPLSPQRRFPRCDCRLRVLRSAGLLPSTFPQSPLNVLLPGLTQRGDRRRVHRLARTDVNEAAGASVPARMRHRRRRDFLFSSPRVSGRLLWRSPSADRPPGVIRK